VFELDAWRFKHRDDGCRHRRPVDLVATAKDPFGFQQRAQRDEERLAAGGGLGEHTFGRSALSRIFTRVRPINDDNLCLWFQGDSNHSFPSGEAAAAAGLVTPYILEYGSEYPATYALMLLPLYVGMGRIKNQAHWQTDILAGWAVGGASGWYAHSLDVPIMIELLPHGIAIGYRR
jgi:membrane-associated phospholipid phosphatase